MDPEAWRRACVACRAKLSRDTGTNLTAATCERLLGTTFGRGGAASLQSNPGLFYTNLGDAIEEQTLALVIKDRLKVAWWCFREAAEVHKHPVGMGRLGNCLYHSQGVTEDPVQAVAWYQQAADLGDAPSKVALGTFFLRGCPRAGVAEDAARGFALLREAFDLGHSEALFYVAQCYVFGVGVEKDAVHRVSLLRQVVNQEDDTKAKAETTLTMCNMEGEGVEADTVQASLWCQLAADGGDAWAIQMLPMIRTCNFCGTTPARKHCERCRTVRYCDTTCQAAHWNRETDPHKGHCRRAAPEASQQEAGGTSTSAQ